MQQFRLPTLNEKCSSIQTEVILIFRGNITILDKSHFQMRFTSFWNDDDIRNTSEGMNILSKYDFRKLLLHTAAIHSLNII